MSCQDLTPQTTNLPMVMELLKKSSQIFTCPWQTSSSKENMTGKPLVLGISCMTNKKNQSMIGGIFLGRMKSRDRQQINHFL